MKDLKGRVAAVTGAGSGIGRATAIALAEAGCDLAISDVDMGGLAETAQRIEALGRKVSSHQVDVSQRQQVAAYADAVIQAHGHAHILINNAGVALSQTVESLELEDMEWIFGINFWGVVYGCHYFLPQLKREEAAHIVNLSSLFGLIGVPTQSAYCATKFAVRGFTESFRAELIGTSIGITSVHPGGIATQIAENARFKQGLGGRSHQEAVEEFKKVARTSAEQAAAKIVRGIKRNKPRVVIGADAWLLGNMARLMPARYTKPLLGILQRL